jgi:hypothetical protein
MRDTLKNFLKNSLHISKSFIIFVLSSTNQGIRNMEESLTFPFRDKSREEVIDEITLNLFYAMTDSELFYTISESYGLDPDEDHEQIQNIVDSMSTKDWITILAETYDFENLEDRKLIEMASLIYPRN